METLLRRTAEPHEPVYEDGLLRIFRTGRRGRLALRGDVDASNVSRLAGVLSAESGPSAGSSGGPASLHLELSGLEFMDVGGCRLLVHTAAALFGDGERRLVLHGLAPHLRRVMRVVGWDSTPGLDIAR
ncbi:STAS domain-containing protein [Peterkaempfera griseoplana]|uniref:STAS domain-containing protein n=1 Tax=Peterkaempfera griseoplana TaxID=66896 RepID=UPI0006E1B5A0|nr:STAS domain-containing protein [Peterkaempfera griseoplana]